MVGTATDALAVAESTVGRREDPPGSNVCRPFTDPIPGQPWCGAWCRWVLRQVGHAMESWCRNPFYVPTIVADARRSGMWVPIPFGRPGDLVCFDWQRDGLTDHVGMIVANRPASGEVLTIEGNTSYHDQSNGGQVMRRTRRYAQCAGAVRIPYETSPPSPPPAPPPVSPGRPPLVVLSPVPSPTPEAPMWLVIDTVGIYAVMPGPVVVGIDLPTFAQMRDRSPGVPVLTLPRDQGQVALGQLLKASAAAQR